MSDKYPLHSELTKGQSAIDRMAQDEYPLELADFCVPSVPTYHDFSQDLLPSDNFFFSRSAIASQQQQDENESPAILASAATFKRPLDPPPASNAPSSSTQATTAADEPEIVELNLAALAACNPPRKPLRRSQLVDASATSQSTSTNANRRSGVAAAGAAAQARRRSGSRGPQDRSSSLVRQSSNLSQSARAAALAAQPPRRQGSVERGAPPRREGSIDRTAPPPRRPSSVDRTTRGSSVERNVAPPTRRSALSANRPRVPAAPIRSSTGARAAPVAARPAGPVRVGGVMTRSQAAAAARAANGTAVDELATGVAKMNVQSTRTSTGLNRSSTTTTADRAGRERLRRSGSMATGAAPPTRPATAASRPSATVRPTAASGPVRVARTPHTDALIASVPTTQRQFNEAVLESGDGPGVMVADGAPGASARATVSRMSRGVAASPATRGAAAGASATRAATTRTAPTSASINRLSTPRTAVAPSAVRRSVAAPSATAGTPRVPAATLRRSAGSTAPANAPRRVPPPTTAASSTVGAGDRNTTRSPRVNINSVVARLSQPRTNATTTRTSGRVAVGHTHGVSVSTRISPRSAFRSRSASRDGRAVASRPASAAAAPDAVVSRPASAAAAPDAVVSLPASAAAVPDADVVVVEDDVVEVEASPAVDIVTIM